MTLLNAPARAVVSIAAWLALTAGCASTTPAFEPRVLPSNARERDGLLASFGERLYTALTDGHLERVLADSRARAAILKPDVAGRPARSVSASAITPADRTLWASAQYAGLCVQQGRTEYTFGTLGLRKNAFVFERGLLIGREPGGGDLAGWVEGTFVLTQQGFIALAIERVEPPRRDHADLELAECEIADRRPVPQHVVSSPGAYH
jgi:hypothetical protein